MKLFLIAIIASWTLSIALSVEKQKASQAEVTAAFNNDCKKLLILNIKKASKTIYGAIYTFTNKDIAQAFITQANKNVQIYLKIDKEQAKFNYTKRLISMMRKVGIKITLIAMKKSDYMHNKFAIIDKQIVITGSFNWTINASRDNYENIVAIQSKEIADQYIKEWDKLK